MVKRAMPAVLGFFGLCLPLAAQQTLPEQLFLDGPMSRSPGVSLENQDRFFFSSAFGALRPSENYLPAFNPEGPQSFAYSPATNSRRNSLDNIADLRAPSSFSYGGEMGFFYGKSSGKYGREDFATYILGTVGNDKFQITAGFLHQESTFSNPRRR
ncbi:MAG: hypothetical protein DLM73_08685 [Chthoniobacterales bacterium]|nr:MAG: hypothetical protein DLM73_08685 [Chthoniobacterales bacterium]